MPCDIIYKERVSFKDDFLLPKALKSEFKNYKSSRNTSVKWPLMDLHLECPATRIALRFSS